MPVQAQDYVSCSTYNEYGDFEKSKACLNSLESKYPNDPGYFYYRMYQALRSGNTVAADKLFESISKYPPADFYILSAKTSYLVYKGDLSQAKTVYESVLKNHKTAAIPVLLDVARSFISFKNKDASYTLLWVTTLEKELKAPHPGVLMLKADYFAALGDHGNALNYYNMVLDAEPGNSIALYKKAVAYRRIKNSSAALAELDAAIRSKPEFPLAVLEKAEVLFEVNKPEEGITFYNNYFKMMPSNTLAHLQFGSSLFSAKKYNEAEKEADFILLTDSTNVSALKLKSYTSYELGRYPEGIIILENYLIKADTATIQAKDYEYLAHYYQKTESDSLAIEAFKKALEAPDARQELFSEAGSLMVKKGRNEDAIIAYQNKLQRFNGSSADYYNYGRAALAIENYVLADSIFAKVIEMQPAWPNGFLMRANANTHLDPASTEGKALPYYEQYVPLALNDTANFAKHKNGLIEAYKYMGYYNYLAKNIEKSKLYWRKVLELDPDDKQAKDVLKQL